MIVPRVLLAAALACPALAPAKSAVFYINTPADLPVGSATDCPLRAALKNIANNDESGLPFGVKNANCPKGESENFVYFTFPPEPGGRPVVRVDPALGPLAFNHNKAVFVGVTLDGQGMTGVLELYGDTNPAVLRLHHATVRNGREFPGGSGAGILVQGKASLHLEDVRIVGNLAGGNGGGVNFESQGELVITKTYFGANSAPSGYGGALAVHTTTQWVRITDSTFEDNDASGGGGAIYCSSSATPFTLSNSSVRSNRVTYAYGTGGGLHSNCRTTVRIAEFANNRVLDGSGGAVYSSGLLNIEDASFVENAARDVSGALGIGGAILSNGDLYVSRTGFFQNSADREGGAIAIDDASKDRTVHLANSTFAENESLDDKGMLHPGAAIWIADVAFAASDEGAGMKMQNLTLFKNLGSSQLFLQDMGQSDTRSIQLANSLLIGTTADEGFVDVCAGRIERLAYSNNGLISNTQFPGTTCDQATDKIPVIDLKLGSATPPQGGYFGQVYVPEASMAFPTGDYALCSGKLVKGMDQFQNPRKCRQGAVEGGPRFTRSSASLPH